MVDDFDLNEIFADYFITEFDDPMNAYTGGMANYSGGIMPDGGVNSGGMGIGMGIGMGMGIPSQQNTGGVALPTGGIRTVFHSGVQEYPQPPMQKKFKQDIVPQAPMMQQMSHPGAMMMAQQQQVPDIQMQGTSDGRVPLPVGVGIRLGGVGGISPATAQAAPRAPGVPGAYIWGPNSGGQPDHAMAERRQRNREHAKRSRVRKKFMLESLQADVLDLQRENQNLRMMVQEHIPESALSIIAECCTSNPLFADDEDIEFAKAQNKKAETFVQSDFALMQSLTTGQQCFVLSDPKLPDNPIVFASPGFYKLTGYTSKEVLGRNCRFLQGPGTNPRAVDVIRKAIAAGSDATVCLLNYKADGTPFWNQFFIAALRDSDNCIVNYVSTKGLHY